MPAAFFCLARRGLLILLEQLYDDDADESAPRELARRS